MWNAVDGMRVRQYKRNGVHKLGYFIDGQPVSEGIFKRRYVAALESENEQLHEKLAKIYEIL
ncbi:hypothetical protein BAAM0483_02890 [Bifidobacterium animalis subsp. animalis MCC 0483]|uniref:Uncharacterized protein n=2 Tax=Bifidobacterium animalis TaxID=28025 RepID=A0AB34TAM6_9BIFI|nr:hypothetical protein BAAM0483_02890 [Bifidobacterium animalis subsp. animalis MCC 0483]